MEAETTEVDGGLGQPSSAESVSAAVDMSVDCSVGVGGDAIGSGSDGDTDGNSFLVMLSTCGSCKETLRNREPKLLSCLHTFCTQCISMLDADDGGLIKCPTCHQVCHTSDMIDNVFLPLIPTTSGDNSSGVINDDAKICTGCEDNITATYFCMECAEWLCDQCEQAHKRVKVTKDHTIETKENAPHGEERKEPVRNQLLPCPIHPQEQLKLYCNTCSKLTCRDCQLVEHKEHKYQFLQEASSTCKDYIQNLLAKIKEKQTYIENAKSLIDIRNKEIVQKEQAVIQEVKHFAMSLITEINLKGRQLISDLQSICRAKKQQLEQKDHEVQLLSSNLEHSLKFAEHLLRNGDSTELLYSRKTLTSQLHHILQTRCEVPNPYHVVDLRFASNPTIAASVPKLGYIIVDGIQFSGRTTQNVNSSLSSCSSNGILPGNISSSTQRSPATLGSSSSLPTLPHGQTGYASSLAGGSGGFSQMTSEQKMALLLSMRRSFDRRHNVERRQQMLQQQVQQQQQSTYRNQQQGRQHDFSFGGQRLTHLPNQSANISSTNLGHQQQQQQQKVVASTYYPALPAVYSTSAQTRSYTGAQISLSQLQMRRQQTEAARQGINNTSLKPIVIQPTGPYQSTTSQDGFQENNLYYNRQSSENRQPYNFCSTTSFAAMKSEMSDRPLNVKLEVKSPFSLDLPELCGNASDSRTPTPCIESTELELLSELSTELFDSDATVNANLTETDKQSTVVGWVVDPASDSSSCQMSDFNNSDQVTVNLGDTLSLPSSPLPDIIRMRSADDPSDDYCAVCRNGGDLLCCDGCPKVFHLGCHVLQLTDNPSGQWYCGLCTKEDTIRMDASEVRSVSGLSTKRYAPSGLTQKEQKVCERLLLELFCHEASMPFHESVSKSVPNYYKVISNPMDFSAIRHKISKSHFDHYSCIDDFIADVRLVFSNCQTFNHPETEIGKAGRTMEEFFEERVGQLLPFHDLRSITPRSDQSESRSGRSKRRRGNGGGVTMTSSSNGKKSSLSSGDEEINRTDDVLEDQSIIHQLID